MDKSYPSKTPMAVRSLDVEKDQFRRRVMEKRYWDQNFDISVLLERLCILQITPGPILHLK